MRSKMSVKTKSKPSGKVQTPQGEQLPNYRKNFLIAWKKIKQGFVIERTGDSALLQISYNSKATNT